MSQLRLLLGSPAYWSRLALPHVNILMQRGAGRVRQKMEGRGGRRE